MAIPSSEAEREPCSMQRIDLGSRLSGFGQGEGSRFDGCGAGGTGSLIGYEDAGVGRTSHDCKATQEKRDMGKDLETILDYIRREVTQHILTFPFKASL
jgi:hypothetical protein